MVARGLTNRQLASDHHPQSAQWRTTSRRPLRKLDSLTSRTEIVALGKQSKD